MFKMTRVSAAVLAVLGGISASSVLAQQQQLERVEVTGSSVRRIDAESALPVMVLKREDIERSGATSTVDLLRRVTSVQGATGEASSVGGATFGFSGVSVHNIGETRTLVLLNGHRLSLFGGQTLTGFAAGFDLNAIPVSAIERVEVLTDGASALYGADAIAGVVNFITKRDLSKGDLSVGISKPDGGAEEKRFSISKGFGNVAADGYNLMLAYAHDERTQLLSSARSYGKTGLIQFEHAGKRYQFKQFSQSPIPANATNDAGLLFSPYLKANGSCPEKTFRITDAGGDYCGYDFVGDLEIYPERKRDSAFASFTKRLGEHELFADLLWSKTEQTSRIAPVPGNITIAAGSALHDKYLKPWGVTGDSTAAYRLFDMGKRTNNDTAKFFDLSLGVRGAFAGWDYNAGFTHSKSDVAGVTSGYPGAMAVGRLRASGLLDPFVGPGKQSAEAMKAIAGTNYVGYWDGGVSKLTTAELRGSRELLQLPAGPMLLGVGVNLSKEDFASKPSLFAQGLLSDPVAGTIATKPEDRDQRFGDASAKGPYSAGRKLRGGFAELVIPVVKGFELGTAIRYDRFSDFGGTTTFKESFRWTPTSNLLIRGSLGSGYHAPTVSQINSPLQAYGVTSDKYDCSDPNAPQLAAMAKSLGVLCHPGSKQYDQLAGGNPELKPEKSRQATLGVRFEPTKSVTLGADLWWVGITDAFGQLPEQLVFGNPQAYASSWGKQTDVGTGKTYLAFKADNRNLGKAYHSGIDLDFATRMKLAFGDWNSQFTATYMIREDQQQLKDGPYNSAIGDYSKALGVVTFRVTGRWTNTLKAGPWTHTLGINFKSGFKDQEKTVEVLDASGKVTGKETIRLDVGYYATADWQTGYELNKSFVFTGGVLNLFDKNPPLSISTSGANRGQPFGYDPRYYDPRGRTVYLNGTYKF
ncbi:TonB-dependent receptor [Roseateles sp. DAIF2]|nr:TonB-dependent receptor [Roseateles sp. DAIF2]